MDREQIKSLLPHREPMLLIDEVVLDGQTARGTYKVRGDEWFLQGHFPENPIVPGVIQCEIAGQTSCVLFKDQLYGKLPLFTGMDKIKFKRQIRPGDLICTECEKLRQVGNFCFIRTALYVDQKLCMSGEFSFALVTTE